MKDRAVGLHQFLAATLTESLELQPSFSGFPVTPKCALVCQDGLLLAQLVGHLRKRRQEALSMRANSYRAE